MVWLPVNSNTVALSETERFMSRTFLSKYESYSKICIQCHDNPDADALASGYALFKYYSSKGIETSLIYGGPNRITKPNLKMMCEKLEIPVEYAATLPECDLLITVDCRYGESNVTHFDAKKVAVIDHHESMVPSLLLPC